MFIRLTPPESHLWKLCGVRKVGDTGATAGADLPEAPGLALRPFLPALFQVVLLVACCGSSH